MKLSEALQMNRGVGPGFHFLRHALSFIIIAHHCRIAIRGVEEATYAKGAIMAGDVYHQLTYGQMVIEAMRPGLYALVGMFFALSGFLVTGSALRNPTVSTFFANRALRIVPALSVEVTLSAIILGPIVTMVALSQYFSDPLFLRYFLNILGVAQYRLPGVFADNPWAHLVNANMWTLAPEFWCYAITLLLMGTGLIVKRRFMTVAIVVAVIVSTLAILYDPTIAVHSDSTRFARWFIVLMFFLGMLFHIAADKIPLSPVLFVACAAGYYVLTIFNLLGPVAGIMLTYCMVYLGFMTFPWFDRMIRDDMSYGMYLYGFPITQTAVWLLLPRLDGLNMIGQFAIIFPLVVATTMLFSIVSWKTIERPALRLKKYTTRFMKDFTQAPPRAPDNDFASNVGLTSPALHPESPR
jgi:peptidoglycan/LPS O-acetylase OafA/YrhL